MTETMKVNTDFGVYECTPSVGEYYNGHIAVQLFCDEGPFATITVNVDGIESFDKDYSCLDTNNCPWVEKFVKEYNLGTFEGVYLNSGYCMYPVYRLNRTEINLYSAEK